MDERFDDEFGLCPVCHKVDDYLNAGSKQYFYCEAHKKAWCVGTVFEDWRDQTKHEQRRIWEEMGMEHFEQVEPYFYSRPEYESIPVSKAGSAMKSYDEASAPDPRKRQELLKSLVGALEYSPKSFNEVRALNASEKNAVLEVLTEELGPSTSFDEAGVLDAREREVVLKALAANDNKIIPFDSSKEDRNGREKCDYNQWNSKS
jgi:translation initiation factor 2 beta subunit (eIF-2beta)/eIF-5